MAVPLFVSIQNTRPAPPFPMFCYVSEKILSPLSYAQQLAIILIEGVVAAWMNSGFFLQCVFHLDPIHFTGGFPSNTPPPNTSAPFL